MGMAAPQRLQPFPSKLHKLMTRNVLVSLLRQGSTGSEILQILDSVVSGLDDTNCGTATPEPTSEPIAF